MGPSPWLSADPLRFRAPITMPQHVVKGEGVEQWAMAPCKHGGPWGAWAMQGTWGGPQDAALTWEHGHGVLCTWLRREAHARQGGGGKWGGRWCPCGLGPHAAFHACGALGRRPPPHKPHTNTTAFSSPSHWCRFRRQRPRLEHGGLVGRWLECAARLGQPPTPCMACPGTAPPRAPRADMMYMSRAFQRCLARVIWPTFDHVRRVV